MRISNQGNWGDAPLGLEGLALRFAQAISHTGLNQSEFARTLGISAGFVSDVVRGQKKPGAEFLYAVRTTFGISVDWLLTGEGNLTGNSGIDLDLLRTVRLQIAVARSAIIDANPTAKALLLLIRDGRLQEAAAEPDIRAFLDLVAPTDPDAELAIELYNGQLWTTDAGAQRRNLLAAAMAHFEARKPIDKVAALARSSGSTIQINISPSQRNAGRDYHEG
ncbi:helix-turn-helix domain-containing protein [Quatrionicoccus australiensis]|uniref:helix-turn-helix domain-containing protein n=1 Tax=Quatrionicoccus australiensis TaxID=138118 RepID=UPI001CF8E5FA|nr:helix-turn-helix domain-containing protein [Quatrionicoccus australiensis]UCV16647.1 helix-turn-helix domain-containing protein [Quatrionicoccus australiensis]